MNRMIVPNLRKHLMHDQSQQAGVINLLNFKMSLIRAIFSA